MQRKVDVCTAKEPMAFCLGDCGQVIQEVDSHLTHSQFSHSDQPVGSYFFSKMAYFLHFESVQIGHLFSFGMSDTDPEAVFLLCVSFPVKQW